LKALAVDLHFAKPVVAFDGEHFYKAEPGMQGLLRLVEQVKPATIIIEDNAPLRIKISLSQKIELHTVNGREVAKERRRRGVKKNDKNDAQTIYRLFQNGKARRFNPPPQELLQLKAEVEEYLRLSRLKRSLERHLENGQQEVEPLLEEVGERLKHVKKSLEKRYGSISKAIIASFTPQELPLRRWLALCGLRGNKGYNRALRHALASLARSKILGREEPYYGFFKAYMEAKKKQSVNGAGAFKLAWMKLAQKIAVQVWREANGLPVDLEKLYKA